MPRWSVRSADNGGSGYAISSRRRLFPVDVVCHSVFFRLHRRSLDHAELSFARGFQDRRFRNAEVLQPHAGSDDPVVFSSRRCVVDELVTVPVTVVVITMALGIYAPCVIAAALTSRGQNSLSSYYARVGFQRARRRVVDAAVLQRVRHGGVGGAAMMAKPTALRRRHQTASEVGEYRLDGEVGRHVAATMVAVVAARQRRRSGRPPAVSVRLHRVIWQRVSPLASSETVRTGAAGQIRRRSQNRKCIMTRCNTA